MTMKVPETLCFSSSSDPFTALPQDSLRRPAPPALLAPLDFRSQRHALNEDKGNALAHEALELGLLQLIVRHQPEKPRGAGR